jgi:cytochrome oxidase Cu insertion factor (SCO1/SenC/PrrC family)
MNKILRNLAYLVLGLACMAAGIFIASQQFSSMPELRAVQLLPGSKKITGINLQSTREQGLHSDFFAGYWTLVFFGFTSCPDFCPMELQKISKALRLAGDTTDMRVLFVSVDPERDTLEKLQAYLEFFHPDIVGATGDNKAIAMFAQTAHPKSYVSLFLNIDNLQFTIDNCPLYSLIRRSPQKVQNWYGLNWQRSGCGGKRPF